MVAILIEPHVGLARAVEHLLERQAQGTHAPVGRKSVSPTRVMDESSHETASAGHIPHAARPPLGDDRGPTAGLSGLAAQFLIVAAHVGEQLPRLFLPAIEHAVEDHPLGTAQRRGLHVVGCLDDGNAHIAQFVVAPVVLVGRNDHSLGPDSHQPFDVGAHAAATIGHAALGGTPLQVGYLNVFQVAYAADGVLGVQVVEQTAVHRGEDHAASDGRIDHRALGQGACRGRILPRNEHIGVQCLALMPRVGKRHERTGRMLDDGEEAGKAQPQRVSRPRNGAIAAAVARGEKA